MVACVNGFTPNSDFSTPELDDWPPYLCDPEDLSLYGDIGTRVMNEMLLTQYVDSPNLIEYISAYVKEMDFLLHEIKKVELGRFIKNAEGAQLDVIGVILQQSRGIPVSKEWFGFERAIGSLPFASQNNDTDAGFFRSVGDSLFSEFVLFDETYRNLLLGRAMAITEEIFDVNSIYNIVERILGYTPKHIVLRTGSLNVLELEFDSSLAIESYNILNSVAHWFTPLGYKLTIIII